MSNETDDESLGVEQLPQDEIEATPAANNQYDNNQHDNNQQSSAAANHSGSAAVLEDSTSSS